jgi:hypothetical protein
MSCSDKNWQALWEALHAARGDEVLVSRLCLNDVVDCDGKLPPTLKVNRTNVLVRRSELFAFLKRHGEKRCDLSIKTAT